MYCKKYCKKFDAFARLSGFLNNLMPPAIGDLMPSAIRELEFPSEYGTLR